MPASVDKNIITPLIPYSIKKIFLGYRPRSWRVKNTGFTLLEMMMVILIIAVIAATVGVNITGESPQKHIDRIGDKLYRQMLLAADTALLSGNTVGLQIERIETKNGAFLWQYAWYGYVNNRWEILSKPLTTTRLPDDVTVELLIEDERIDDFSEVSAGVGDIEENTGSLQPSPTTIKPEIVISPSGELTDFTLRLSYRAELNEVAVYQISVDETGQLTTGGDAEQL